MLYILRRLTVSAGFDEILLGFSGQAVYLPRLRLGDILRVVLCEYLSW